MYANIVTPGVLFLLLSSLKGLFLNTLCSFSSCLPIKLCDYRITQGACSFLHMRHFMSTLGGTYR